MSADDAPRFDFDRPVERRRGAGRGSKFFVLDRSLWDYACSTTTNNRLNLLTAMLVLSAGTGSDQRLTKWSTKACERYAGMGKPRAALAIQELLKARLISLSPKSTGRYPQYMFAAAPANSSPIFLPIQLVTGFGSETPVLRRVRETGDEILLRMLIDLYGRVQIDATHGVPLEDLRRCADTSEACRKVVETGVHAVWSLTESGDMWAGGWRAPYAGKKVEELFWPRIHQLQNIGALWFEPWVFSSDCKDAEPLFPVGAPDPKGGPLSLSERTWLVAGLLAADRPYLLGTHSDKLLVVLPAHHTAPAVRGVARLRVEADTPGRRAAFAARAGSIRFWHGEYERLSADLKIGRTDRPIRTAAAVAAD